MDNQPAIQEHRIPFHIASCPVFSLKEQLIISYIVDFGKTFDGCLLSNNEIAIIFHINNKHVSDILWKAVKLGWAKEIDPKYSSYENFVNKPGRKISIIPTEEWQIFGQLYKAALFDNNIDSWAKLKLLKKKIKSATKEESWELVAKSFAAEIFIEQAVRSGAKIQIKNTKRTSPILNMKSGGEKCR